MKRAYANGILLDGTEQMEPVRGKVLLTENDKITAIADAGANLDGYEVIDLRGGYLYIYGGMLILGGGLAVLIEFLINLTFQIHETLFWSFYPMVAGIVLGLMLIVIAICKPLRESLHRKFFL